jgi:hypothetical protein
MGEPISSRFPGLQGFLQVVVEGPHMAIELGVVGGSLNMLDTLLERERLSQ